MIPKSIRKTLSAVALSAAAVSVAVSPSLAQDLGEFEFMNSCVACHGASGKGAGSMAAYLNTSLPDLTQLQKDNGGVFPFSRVYASIDGSSGIGPHGSREMPVWGMRYKTRAADDPDFSAVDEANYPQARILALIEYLSSIQDM